MSSWQPGQWLTGWDASTWAITANDPSFGSAVVGLFELEGQLGLGQATTALQELTDRQPLLRERIQQTGIPLLPARTEILSTCDVSDLITHVSFDSNIRWRDVREIVATQIGLSFDSDKPAWRVVLVNSSGGEAPSSFLIFSLHHALLDGVGAVSLAHALMNASDQKSEPFDVGLNREDLAATLVNMASSFGAKAFTEVLSFAAEAMASPQLATSKLREVAASVIGNLNPLARPLSSLLAPRSGYIRAMRLGVPLAPLRALAKNQSVSLTSVMLTAISRGMSSYHARMGDNTSALRVNVPVALPRTESERNALAVSRMKLELNSSDDATLLMKRINTELATMRVAPALRWANVAADVSRLLPNDALIPFVSGLVGGADITVSSLHGPDLGSIAGHQVLSLTPFAPVFGAAVSLNLMSQGPSLWLGLCCDTSAVRHPKVLVAELKRGFDEMAGLAA